MNLNRGARFWVGSVAALVVLLSFHAAGGALRAPNSPRSSGQGYMGPSAALPLPVTSFNLTKALAYPIGITTDRAGNVWFTEDNFDAIVEYIPTNGTFRTFNIPTTQHLAWIWFLVFDNSGNLWFSDDSQSLLWRLNPSTGKFANFTAGGAYPLALAYDSARNRVWFSSLKTNQVGYFELSGGDARLGQTRNFTAPAPGTGVAGVVVGPSGNIFVAESFQAKIIELNSTTFETIRTWNLPTGSEPVGLALDEARGRLWFTNHASSFFGYVDLNSAHYTEYPTSLLFQQGSYTVTLPYWIQLSSSGDVWFNEHFANKIARFDPNTSQLTEFEIPTNNSSPLRFFVDDPHGVVWFTEFEGNAVGMVAENSSTTARVNVSSPFISFSSSGKVTVTASPQGASPEVSTNSSIAGNASPGFITSLHQSGGSYVVEYSANRATPGNYSSAICFSYPGYRQCGYVFLGVRGLEFGGLLLYGVYAGVGGGGILLALVLLRKFRRGDRRSADRG